MFEAPPEIGKLKRAFEQTSAHAVNVGFRRKATVGNEVDAAKIRDV